MGYSQKDAYVIAVDLGDKNKVVLRGFYVASFLRLYREIVERSFSKIELGFN